MQIVVIIVFASLMGVAQPGGPRIAQAPWPLTAALALAHVLATAAMMAAASNRGIRRLSDSRWGYARTVKAFRRASALAQAWMAGSMVLLVMLGAVDLLRRLPVMGWPLAAEAALLGLFVTALVCYWRLGYPFEHACRQQVEQDLMVSGMPVRRGWTAGEHLEFNMRHNLFFVAAPLTLIMLLHYLIGWAARTVPLSFGVAGALRIAAVAGVFFISPMLLVGVWRTRPLAAGALRERLERLCGRIGLSYRRILVWDTGGVLANAAVMGLHRSVRYILISDALLEQLTDDQIASVFGHEAGHIRHRHMLLFVLFIVSVSLICGSAGAFGGMLIARVGGAAETAAMVEELVMTVGLGILFWQGFGRLSRLLERQADVYGAVCAGYDAELTGCGLAQPDMPPGMPASSLRFACGARVFISALEAIARINGMPREGRNWRHGSIARRVEFLWHWRCGGYDGESFDRSIRSVQMFMWMLLAVGLLGLALTWQRWT